MNRKDHFHLIRDLDIPLLVTVVLLVIGGLVMVYSASWPYAYVQYGSDSAIALRQAAFAALGLVLMLLISALDYHHWRKAAIPVMFVTLALLVAVLLFGEVRFNARRTLLHGSITPAELAKLVIVIYLAVWLESRGDEVKQWTFGLLPLALILGIVSGLIWGEPDYSAMLTVILLGIAMFTLSSVPVVQMLVVGGVAGLVAYGVVTTTETGQSRLADYLAGLRDPTQNGSYQVQKAMNAILRGGWLGRGLGQGEVKLIDLPLPHLDSVFAVIAEETGVLGGLVVIVLFSFLFLRGLSVARRAPDFLGFMLAAGATLWLTLEAVLNIAGVINLMPVGGNALPFFSAGGSNLVVSLLAAGLILSVSRQAEQGDEMRRYWRATVDLRRRHRRRGVSRAGRVAGAEKPTA